MPIPSEMPGYELGAALWPKGRKVWPLLGWTSQDASDLEWLFVATGLGGPAGNAATESARGALAESGS
jgi:hypothetical protein